MIVTGKVSIHSVIIDQRHQLYMVLISSLIAVGIYEVLGKRWVSIQITPLTALGVALGVFLSLRNNVVYERYWEARTLWGRLVNVSRTFLRQLAVFLRPRKDTGGDKAERETFIHEMAYRQIAFAQAFCAHLRGDVDGGEGLEKWIACPSCLAKIRKGGNIPAALVHQMGERLHDAWQRGMVSDFHLARLDESMTEFTDILGGCERIRNTPLPPAYTYLSHKIVLFYCCLVPFGLVADIRFLTPALALAIAFAFLTLDRISDLIESPFSRGPNDLPLDALTRIIEIDTLKRLDEDAPPPLEAVDGVLL